MSGLVLVVGALVLAAGGYEMVVGSGDILSERGWSAFIAGAVLVSGGVVTMALGLTLRALDRLRGAMMRSVATMPVAIESAERIEPGAMPIVEQEFTEPAPHPNLIQESALEATPVMPALVAAPIIQDQSEKTFAEAAPPRPLASEPLHQTATSTSIAEPQQDDWLDHSFAELEREMAERHEPVGVVEPEEPRATTADATAVLPPEPPPVMVMVDEPHASRNAYHEEPVVPAVPPIAHLKQAESVELPVDDHATVSAREELAPATSPVIGRYESEGTSYVMYADGSIDAQSEAGVYRFASMAELKTFIES